MKILIACMSLVAAVAAAQNRFYPFAIDQDKLAGLPDFSRLNRALTPADKVSAKDGHFYTVGSDLKPYTADDRRIRFFGANLAFGANFPEPQDAARIAKRLWKLGINLVRLHHMDTSPTRDPATARSIPTDGPFPSLNPVSLARLRSFLMAVNPIWWDRNLVCAETRLWANAGRGVSVGRSGKPTGRICRLGMRL